MHYRLPIIIMFLLFIGVALFPIVRADQIIGAGGGNVFLPMNHPGFATATGLFVVYCSSGSNIVYASSSNGGGSWSATTTVSSCDTSLPDVWYDGQYVYLAARDPNICSAALSLCYSVGTIAGASITFDTFQHTSFNDATSSGGPQLGIAPDTTGHIYMTIDVSNATRNVVVDACTCTGQAAWASAAGFPKTLAKPGVVVGVHPYPLLNNKMAVLYTGQNLPLSVQSYTGSSFNPVANSTDTVQNDANGYFDWSAVSTGDTVTAAFYDNSNNIAADVYSYSCNCWRSSTIIAANPGTSGHAYNDPVPTISYDPTLQEYIVFWWSYNNQAIYYSITANPSANAWSSPQILLTGVPIYSDYLVASSYAAALNQPQAQTDSIPVFWATNDANHNVHTQSLAINTSPSAQSPNGCVPVLGCPVSGSLLNSTIIQTPLGPLTVPVELVSRYTWQILLGITVLILGTTLLGERQRIGQTVGRWLHGKRHRGSLV